MSKTHINKLACGALILLAGLNLRPALASIAPLMELITSHTGMSYGIAALLTTLPVLIMGAAAFSLGWLKKLTGTRKGVSYALLLIAASCLLRLLGEHSSVLIASAALAGLGIAAIQILIPGMIKLHFGKHTSLMMGLYVTSLMGGATVSAGSAAWLAEQSSWQQALALWSLPAALTALLWLWLAPADHHGSASGSHTSAPIRIHRLPMAWALAIYFGIGTAIYVCTLAWLPPYFTSLGYSAQQGGLMLSYMTAFEVASGLLLPVIASRFSDLRPWLALAIAANLAGLLGISLQGTENSLLWVAILGAGIGGLFPLTMILTLQHLDDPQHAGELTAFVQGIGYIMAAAAPVAAGAIRDLTNSFTLSWLLLAGTASILFAMTLFMRRNTH